MSTNGTGGQGPKVVTAFAIGAILALGVSSFAGESSGESQPGDGDGGEVGPPAVTDGSPTASVTYEVFDTEVDLVSQSQACAAEIVAHEWTVDGPEETVTVTGPEATVAHTGPGQYTIELVVEDARGLTDSVSVPLSICSGEDTRIVENPNILALESSPQTGAVHYRLEAPGEFSPEEHVEQEFDEIFYDDETNMWVVEGQFGPNGYDVFRVFSENLEYFGVWEIDNWPADDQPTGEEVYTENPVDASRFGLLWNGVPVEPDQIAVDMY